MRQEILVVSPEFSYGGIGLHTSKVTTFLLEEDLGVRVHTTKKSKDITRLSHPNLQIIAIARSLLYFDKFNPFFDIISNLSANRIKPCLVIRTLPQFYFRIHFLNNVKIPELVIVHDTFTDLIRAIRLSEERGSIERVLCSRFGKVFIEDEKNILQKSAKVIAVSNYTKNTLLGFYGICAEKVDVIYPPIDTKKFKRKSAQEVTSTIGNQIKEFKKDGRLAIFVGRPQSVKNLRLFLNLSERLSYEQHLKFAVIGIDANDKYIKYYAQQVKHNNVLFCGYINNDLLPDVYSLADFIIITSLSENLPTCLLEAMACGVVPISSSVGGISEVIEDKKNGFLVHSNGRKEFLTIINQLVSDDSLVKVVSRNAQETIKEKLGEEVIKPRFIETVISLFNQ